MYLVFIDEKNGIVRMIDNIIVDVMSARLFEPYQLIKAMAMWFRCPDLISFEIGSYIIYFKMEFGVIILMKVVFFNFPHGKVFIF
jgi:hypothetical protein